MISLIQFGLDRNCFGFIFIFSCIELFERSLFNENTQNTKKEMSLEIIEKD